jgi:hypothetical protein
MSVMANAIKNCLGDQWSLDKRPYFTDANELWLHISESGKIAQITLRTWKLEEKFITKLYMDTR